MSSYRNDEAVSPVIGVVLMVAITVILAAVISTYVFGMTTSVPKEYVVGATFQQLDTDHVTITYIGGQDAASVTNLTVSINSLYAGTIGSDDGSVLKVGCSTTFTANPPHSFVRNTHVVTTAHFLDGTSQVILDYFL